MIISLLVSRAHSLRVPLDAHFFVICAEQPPIAVQVPRRNAIPVVPLCVCILRFR